MSGLDREEQFRATTTNWIQKQWKLLCGLIVISLITWGGFEFMKYNKVQQEQEVSNVLHKYVSAMTKVETQLFSPPDTKDEKVLKDFKAPEKTAELFEKELSAVAANLDAELRNHKGMLSASRIAMQLADTYVEYDQTDKARDLLKAMDPGTSKEVMDVLLRMKKAAVFGTKEHCEEALRTYEEILANSTWKFLHPHAMLRSVGCYMELENHQEAKIKLSQIIADFPDSSVVQKARTFQRLLQLTKPKASTQ